MRRLAGSHTGVASAVTMDSHHLCPTTPPSAHRTASGSLTPLKPLSTTTSNLAMTALKKVGRDKDVANYKAMATSALKIRPEASSSPPRASNQSLSSPMLA